MLRIEKSPTIELHTCNNGKEGWYDIWVYKAHGATVSEEFPRLNLTPEDVEALMEIVNEKIADVFDDLVVDALDELLASH